MSGRFDRAAVDAFADAATAYCSFVDSEPNPESDVQQVAHLLANLDALVLDLPDAFGGDAPDLDSERRADSELAKRFQKLPVDLYWEVFDPLQQLPETPVANSLFDDL